MRTVNYLRVELLDNVYLPLSTKPTESSLISYLATICRTLWNQAYENLEFKPVTVKQQSGLSRSCMPLNLRLQDWYNMERGHSVTDGLQLSQVQKRGLWLRMAVELWSLQNLGLIRDAVTLYGLFPKGKHSNSSQSEDDEAASSSSSTPLLNSDSFDKAIIEFRYFSILLWLYALRNKITQNQANKSAVISSSKNEYSPRGRPRSISDGLLDAASFNSPRKDPSMTVPEHDEMVLDIFGESLYVVLCIIGFHFDAALAYINTGLKSDEPALVAQHLRYVSLLIQMRLASDGTYRRTPMPSTGFETTIFREIGSASEGFSKIPITKLVSHLKSNTWVASIDVSLCSVMNRSRAKFQGSKKWMSSSADHYIVSGKRKELICVPTPSYGTNVTDLSIIDCQCCTVVCSARYRSVKIHGCIKCMIILPAVSACVTITHSSNIDVHAASLSIVVINCYDTQLFAATVSPAIIAGDSRDVSLGPYNVLVSNQRALMRKCLFDLTPEVVGMFSEALKLPLISSCRSVTPREEGEQAIRIIRPSEFSVLILPDTPEEEIESHNLVLPIQYSNELMVKNEEKEKMLNELRTMSQNLSPEIALLFHKRVDQKFQEWLQRNMPKIYNLTQET